jgi:methyl-accepting chemotaxis protein
MGWGIPTLSQATRKTTPRKAEGQVTEANRVAREQAAQQAAQQAAMVAEYNRRLAEQAQKIREIQESAERTQAMIGPAAQDFSKTGEQGDKRVRKSSMRGSLLAGNTGGYNPATGGGRLGGRSLLG